MPAIDHIGIAVKSIEDVRRFMKEMFDLDMEDIEVVESQKVKIGRIVLDNIVLEFLEPTSSDSTISGFIEKRGGGLHHIAFEIEDVSGKLKELKEKGMELIDKEPRKGASYSWIAFLSPRNPAKTLIELVEKKGGFNED